MKRVFVLFAAMVLAASLSVPVLAADVTLTYANFPPAITFPCVQMERWKEEVESRLNGLVEIQTFPGGTLLGAKEMFEGVQQGRADIGCLCMSYQPGVFPLTTVLEIPMGIESAEVASLMLWDLYEAFDPKAFKDVKVLAMFTTAPSNIMSSVPVRTLADLEGLELRASGGASEVLDRLGAVPVSMPMSETPEALQKNLVRGLLSSLEVLMDFKFADLCRFETMTNFQVYPFAVVMNMDSWNALPDEAKQVFDELRREQSRWTGHYMDGHVVESLEWSKKEFAIEIIDWSDADKAKAAELLLPMEEAWKGRAVEAGLDADAILAKTRELKDKYEAEVAQ